MVWELSHQGYNAADAAHLGNKFLIGNGYAGVRGTLEEYGKEQLVAVNLAGVYDQHGTGWREPLNAPNPFFVQCSFNDIQCDVLHQEPAFHMQRLSFRHGVQTRQTVFHAGGRSVTITSSRFACFSDVHLLAMQYNVTADADGRLSLTWKIDGDVWDIHGPHYQAMDYRFLENGLYACTTTEHGEKVAVTGRYEMNCPANGHKGVDGITFHIDAETNKTYTLTVTAAISTTKDEADPEKAACMAELPAYDVLLKRHQTSWEAIWEHAAVTIEGDEAAEQALNYSLYHLLSIAPRHRDDLSVAARGLSGQTYKGAVFWDTEMFMLDFYLSACPEAAKSALNYRIQTLPGALEKARQYGLSGAFYAWESQEGGFDACSDYNVTDVFTGRPMRTYFRDKQIHISAAVVWGLSKYMAWSGEENLLAKGACEVMIQCARFYYSLLVKRVCSDVWELRDVIGPDEYHERVDNNAYTNEMARFVFLQAVASAARLKEIDPKAYKTLEQKISFEKELSAFTEAAEKLKEQFPDPVTHLIPQFDGYFALEDTSVHEVRSRLQHPKEYWGGAYGVATHTQVIKQADVMTMLYLFKNQYTPEVIAANYDYYEPRTEHGSSLSACMYALTACLIGRPEAAYPLFMKSAQADLTPGGKEWAGLVYIGGTHPAAAGGAYMTLLNGFLGLDPARGILTPQPCFPKHWKRVSLQVWYQGQWHLIDVKA